MMSNNADLVSLNQTIRHWKMLNEKILRYVSVSSCEGLNVFLSNVCMYSYKKGFLSLNF